MVNILIADDNVDYAISLMNYINKQNNKIRVCNIARDGKEAIHMLNTNNDIAPKELFFISALLSDMCEHIETANIIKIQNL